METIKLPNPSWGEDFHQTTARAIKVAEEKNSIVEFEFNGVICLVNKDTDGKLLFRDYLNSYVMGWEKVGPKCVSEYDAETSAELEKRNAKKEEERLRREEECRIEEEKQKAELERTIGGIAFDLIPEKGSEYKEYLEKNTKDGYSKAVVDYGEMWARLMQIEVAKGKTIAECAEETQKPLNFMGITGFQYGCVVQQLAYFWKHGEQLRKWHNKEFGVTDENEKGVVNPAVLTIKG